MLAKLLLSLDILLWKTAAFRLQLLVLCEVRMGFCATEGPHLFDRSLLINKCLDCFYISLQTEYRSDHPLDFYLRTHANVDAV